MRSRWLSVGLCAFLLAGCGPMSPSADRRSQPASPKSPDGAHPVLQGGHLEAPFTYGSGSIRFDPPAHGSDAATTSSQAVRAFTATGLYADEADTSRSEVFLASFTSYQKSTSFNQTSGTLVPSTVNELVWVVRCQGVRDISVGAGVGGSTRSPPTGDTSPASIHDVIAIVDATRGSVELVISAAPDTEAEAAPTIELGKSSP
jgi:hypothetical protein